MKLLTSVHVGGSRLSLTLDQTTPVHAADGTVVGQVEWVRWAPDGSVAIRLDIDKELLKEPR